MIINDSYTSSENCTEMVLRFRMRGNWFGALPDAWKMHENLKAFVPPLKHVHCLHISHYSCLSPLWQSSFRERSYVFCVPNGNGSSLSILMIFLLGSFPKIFPYATTVLQAIKCQTSVKTLCIPENTLIPLQNIGCLINVNWSILSLKSFSNFHCLWTSHWDFKTL